MAGQSLPRDGKSCLLRSFLFLLKIGFLSHNFGFRYAEKPIKGSEDVDFRLVSKNMSQKSLVGAHGQIKSAKYLKTPPLVTSPTKNSKPKSENFFE